MFKTNESTLDRLMRALLASILLVIGLFWLSGPLQIISYIIAAILILTAISGFCALYPLLRINTKKSFTKPYKLANWVMAILILLVLSMGSYASDFMTRKIFLEDFNAMNGYYKQVLFDTGQEKRPESIDNYDKLVLAYNLFRTKYIKYQPFTMRSDKEFSADLNKVNELIINVKGGVYNGDLKTTHTQLEEIRPIWQNMFKRNGFSMLAVALVDFHDSMEKVIEPADAGDNQGVAAAYDDANQKLMAVEEEVNDGEIKAIRANLEKLREMANTQANKDELSEQAAVLKASFVKVYLQRG